MNTIKHLSNKQSTQRHLENRRKQFPTHSIDQYTMMSKLDKSMIRKLYTDLSHNVAIEILNIVLVNQI